VGKIRFWRSGNVFVLNSISEVQVKIFDIAMVSIFFFRLALCRRCTGASQIRGLPRKNGRKRLRIALKRTLFMFPRWRLDTRSGHAVQWQLFRCSRFRYQNVRTARGYTLVCAAGAQHAALQSYCVSTTSIVSFNRECKMATRDMHPLPSSPEHKPGTAVLAVTPPIVSARLWTRATPTPGYG